MLTEIKLNGFASFKHATCLQTDKPVNFVYGLNGTGKSSISKYLNNPTDERYALCSMSPALDPEKEEILVYNQDFIHENFVEREHQHGVFTLSKANKKAYDAIKKANEELAELQEKASTVMETQKIVEDTFARAEASAKEKVWEVKSKYYGGDRVLDYCLEGVKGSKANLFAKVKDTVVSPDEKLRSVDVLKQELNQLTAMEGRTYSFISDIPFLPIANADKKLCKKVIVGNQESTISAVMDEFANSTWVRAGMSYLKGKDIRCPFCHQETITTDYIKELKSYFDESYERDIQSLKQLELFISDTLARITPDNGFEDNPVIAPLREKYLAAFGAFKAALADNLTKVRLKIERPNVEYEISDCGKEIQTVNDIIGEANIKITAFNVRVARLPEVKESIKEEFWKIQRREYDATFIAYESAVKVHDKETAANRKINDTIETQRKQKLGVIAANQKDVVNIDEAIAHINNNLQRIGITDFKIVKCDGDDSYRISREGDEGENVFHTLSEGEKMLISFLYFIETCTGRKAADEPEKKKIIVIDDPISSLSHIHIFNIGRLILNSFIVDQPFEQVFIFTHSFYFFYEVVDTNHKRREQQQKLFRITKRADGSEIEEMHYHDLHNDYETYWSIINDPNQHPALIANCMRNVLDYYFGFVERLEYHSLFELPELGEPQFSAFNRFMNRESHSIGENIIDIKEFDYNAFRDALRLVFKTKGHEKHFDLMSKVGARKK